LYVRTILSKMPILDQIPYFCRTETVWGNSKAQPSLFECHRLEGRILNYSSRTWSQKRPCINNSEFIFKIKKLLFFCRKKEKEIEKKVLGVHWFTNKPNVNLDENGKRKTNLFFSFLLYNTLMMSDAIKVIKKSVHNYRFFKTTCIRENTCLCLFYFKRKFICSREKLKNASWT